MPGGTMALIVSSNSCVVEDELSKGKLLCPSCKGVLRPWGRCRTRTVRLKDGVTEVTPRRSRCTSCSKTHALLPNKLLLRRVDEVDVIGSALLMSSTGDGYNKIATAVSRPISTVRSWIRRFRAKAEIIRQHFTIWAIALDPSLGEIKGSGSLIKDALDALGVAVRSATLRFGVRPPFSLASHMTEGRLLYNTSSPFPTPNK